MASANADERVRYEPDEQCPPLVAVGVGIQGALLALAPLVVVAAISGVAAGQDERQLTWTVVAALVVGGIVTILQAARIWRVGLGHIMIMGVTPNYIAVSVLALAEGGPSMLASLLVLSAVFYFAVAAWLPQLRRVITPAVSGTVLMLIAVTLLPIAWDRLTEVSGRRTGIRRTGGRRGDADRHRDPCPAGASAMADLVAVAGNCGWLHRRGACLASMTSGAWSTPRGLGFPTPRFQDWTSRRRRGSGRCCRCSWW